MEMQIKTTMKYHLTLVRMAIVKKTQEVASAGVDVEKREASCTLSGNVYCAASVENSMTFPQKIKNRTTI